MPPQAPTDELSPEEFAAALRGDAAAERELSPEDFAAAIGGTVPERPSALQSFGGRLLGGLANAAEGLGHIGETLGSIDPANRFDAAAGQAPNRNNVAALLRGGAEAVYPSEVRGRGGFLSEDLPGMAGQMLPGIAAGYASPGLAGAVFGLDQGGAAYADTLAKTGSREKAMKSLVGNAAIAQLQELGFGGRMGKVLRRLRKADEATGGAAGKFAMMAAGAAKGVIGAEVAGIAQTAFSDALAEHLTGEDIDILKDVARVAKDPANAALGALGGLAEGLAAARGRVKPEAHPETAQEAPGEGRAEEALGILPEAASPPGAAEEPQARTGPPAEAPEAQGATPEAASVEGAERSPTESPSPGAEIATPEASKPAFEKSTAPNPFLHRAKKNRAEYERLKVASGGGKGRERRLEELRLHAEDMEAKRDAFARGEIDANGNPIAPEPTVEEETRGPDLPEPKAEEPERPIGIKNKTMERELEEMGLPPPEKGEAHKDIELHAKAKETFEKDQHSGENLVNELERSPRPATDAEAALLDFEANRLANERDAAEQAFIAEPSDENKARIEKSRADFKRAADVFDKVGAESGRSLRARRLMVNRDYSLAAMERSIEVAKGGEALTPEESAKVSKLHQEMAAAKKAHEEYVSASEEKRSELEAENALLKLKKDAVRPGRKERRAAEIEQAKKELGAVLDEIAVVSSRAHAGLDPKLIALTAKAAAKVIKIGAKTFAQWAEEMVARFGENIRPYLSDAWNSGHASHATELAEPLKKKTAGGKPLEELGADVRKIAENFVKAGISERQPLIDAVHRVLVDIDPGITKRQTTDAISGYGEFRKLSAEEAKAKLRDLKGEMRALSKLEDISAGEKPEKTGFERRKPTQQELKLSDKAERLAKSLGIELRKKPGPRVSVGTANEELVLQKRTEAKLKARRTGLENRIKELQERISERDFAPKARRELPYDQRAIELKADYEQARRQFEREKMRHERAHRTKLKKAKDLVKEILDLPHDIFSSFDFSAVRRQGGFFTSAHGWRAMKHAREMFKAFANPRAALEADVAIRARGHAALSDAAGLEFTSTDGLGPQEEMIRTRLSQRIPGIPASNRAFVTYLNLQRATAFDAIIDSLPHKPKMEEAKAIADFVNVATGRATGKGKTLAQKLGAIRAFWAPSYVVSRFQLLGRPLTMLGDKRLSFAAKKTIGKEFVRYAAGQAVYYGVLAGAATVVGKSLGLKTGVENDPRSSDFGKVRVGDTRLDPLSGLAQVGTLIARMATGKTKAAGAVKDLGAPGPYSQTRLDVAARFARSKLGPVAGRIVDALAGKTYTGEPVTPSQAILAPPIPGAAKDIYEASRSLGVPAASILGVFALIGDNMQTYEDSSPKKKKAKR